MGEAKSTGTVKILAADERSHYALLEIAKRLVARILPTYLSRQVSPQCNCFVVLLIVGAVHKWRTPHRSA